VAYRKHEVIEKKGKMGKKNGQKGGGSGGGLLHARLKTAPPKARRKGKILESKKLSSEGGRSGETARKRKREEQGNPGPKGLPNGDVKNYFSKKAIWTGK